MWTIANSIDSFIWKPKRNVSLCPLMFILLCVSVMPKNNEPVSVFPVAAKRRLQESQTYLFPNQNIHKTECGNKEEKFFYNIFYFHESPLMSFLKI